MDRKHNVTSIGIHLGTEDRKNIETTAYGKDHGECLGIKIGSTDITIFHRGDAEFLRLLQAKINAAINAAIYPINPDDQADSF